MVSVGSRLGKRPARPQAPPLCGRLRGGEIAAGVRAGFRRFGSVQADLSAGQRVILHQRGDAEVGNFLRRLAHQRGRKYLRADLAEAAGRFWVAPVPLGPRPPTLVTDVDLVLRALPTPEASLGGPALTEALRALYATFRSE